MAFIGYNILATEGYETEIGHITFHEKTIFKQAHIKVMTKGFFVKQFYYFKADFELMEIVHEEETSNDTGQRIKNAAIGAVLLGPIGLLGAAFGGKKSVLKVRFLTKDSKKFLLELKPSDCQKIFKELMEVDLEKEINQKLL